MHGIREVTEEFYGSFSSKKPFNSLEKLEFEDMPEWKLENLLIKNCPKLIGRLPENLCSLTKLQILRCSELNLETPIRLSSLKRFEVIGCPKTRVVFDEAQLFTSQLEGMKQIVELCIDDCNSLMSLPFSILPSTLKIIRISGCQKLKLEGPVGDEMFLEEFRISGCDCIGDNILPRARNLWVYCFHNLTRFLIPPATETFLIFGCKNVEKLLVACGNVPSAMKYLHIEGCLKLKWLPECMQELLPSLKQLYLYDCPEIDSFPKEGLPFNLRNLTIWNCPKLLKGRKELHLHRLLYLRELVIYHDGSDEEIVGWDLPSSIQRLEVSNLKTFSTQLVKSLTSLEYLCINNFLNLQSLSESELPSSLSKLTIMDCPNLRSLLVNGMPFSLSELYICDCPLITPLLEFDKGEYCPNIAQIPNIFINRECL